MSESHIAPGDPALERRLRKALEGEVRFDAFTRGLYATDASHYQIEPLGVVFPKSVADVEAVLEIAHDMEVPVLPRGGGTSQCGQTVGRAVVMDTSRHLTGVGDVRRRDPGRGASAEVAVIEEHGGAVADAVADSEHGDPGTDAVVEVEPGVVLDHLNARLRPHGVWFPVDPATGSRATLGGMAGNNSAGARSLRYGMMVDNVAAAEVVLPDGRRLWLGDGSEAHTMPRELAALRALYGREADEIASRTPRTMRNVAGYRLERLRPEGENLAQLLIGSEGTLAFFSRLRLKLSPLPGRRVVGVCHFPGLIEALDAVRHIVALEPMAVELVDRNVLRLAAGRPEFRSALGRFVRGSPGALLLVEFDTDLRRRLDELDALLGDLGAPRSVVRVEEPPAQAEVWNVRKAGLNIVMSMAGPRKPISFIEDCAVPLEHLSEYARSVDAIFERNGASGTWYAHASVGCLHVRPALDLKDPEDLARVRRIAEETHEVVLALGGTHSGEHGDGILRSEFLRPMLGERMVAAYEEVKRTFDPSGIMNPGKIVDPPRMDDRTLLRYGPAYRERPLPVVLDWSAEGGLLAGVERCNNNGACRKSDPGVMCPSFRVTGDERHSTRGRANALRLALTGQLGDRALESPEMAEAMSLCISCKGCRRECPTGVDMARMKLEWQHRRNAARGVPMRERAVAALPRVGRMASAAAAIANRAQEAAKQVLGLSGARTLPRWRADPWRDRELAARMGAPAATSPEVVLFVDTFTRWFEPEIARAAADLLQAGGWRAAPARPRSGRPLCCGRTYLSAGMLDEARVEARRVVTALAPRARAGARIVGLEPSCLYTLRDELPALLPGEDARAVAGATRLLEEWLDEAWEAGRTLPFGTAAREAGLSGGSQGGAPLPAGFTTSVLVHGHCHQKAFGATGATVRMLARVPGLEVREIPSGCCGMAGAFGYHAEHYDVSMAMAELELLPAVRGAGAGTVIVADGTSCRAQIADGTGTKAVHAAVPLREALERGDERA